MNERRFDVLIAGAGMVGAAAACLLARAGFSVAVVETRKPERFNPDAPYGLRVSAFSPGSAAVLAETGAWRLIEQERHCPYRQMRVEDRDESAFIEFSAPQFGMERLGTIIENDLVQWSLWQSLQSVIGAELFCPAQLESLNLENTREDSGVIVTLDDGRQLRCRLLVGADGADSKVRRLLGISQDLWEYGQCGLVSVVRTRQPNPGVAWQRFLEGGPLAFLPLADGSSSIVWSCPEQEAQRLLAVDEDTFLAELGQAASGTDPHWLQTLEACGQRAVFPLTMRLCERYAANRSVLVGDAAHVVHPLAGQGVNLGLLDTAGLVEVAVEARRNHVGIGSDKVLRKYERWRRSEAEVMARGIHGLRGLFTPESLGPLRKLGLGLVSRSWTAQEMFIRRAAGINRNAPALARGEPLASLLHPEKSS